MSVRLSHGQAEIITLASKGHNLFVTGQGGTGKSTVVREIISNLQAVGKKVSVVCSSGIACTVSWSRFHRAFLLWTRNCRPILESACGTFDNKQRCHSKSKQMRRIDLGRGQHVKSAYARIGQCDTPPSERH